MQPSSARLPFLDLWRGVVVFWMALDHAHHFLGRHPFFEMPGMPRPTYESFGVWCTRFVTHYCAPSFVFLAGVSAVLMTAARRARGESAAAVSEHLALRGVVLIVFEYTIVAAGWGEVVAGGVFQVIACIGACLILAVPLRHLPAAVALALGFLLMFLHPLLADWVDLPRHWERVLLEGGFGRWPTIYPVVPWLAAFLLGLGFGHLLLRSRELASRALLAGGLGFLALWLTLRLAGGFTIGGHQGLGNLIPHDSDRGFYDFMLMSKYPPAADFLCWTLGGGFLCAWAVRSERVAGARTLAPLRLFGRVPMFFYITHLFVYRWLGEALVESEGAPWSRGLPATYAGWALGLLLLIPLCAGFAWLKQRWRGFPLDLV
jgi:uncharacterized membrane protein